MASQNSSIRCQAVATDNCEEETAPVQAEWVEAKRESIVDVYLNQRSSMLWDYVDRRSFENIMSSKTPDKVRRHHCTIILSIATLFCYEAELLGRF